MPFIGNTPDVNFTSFAKQTITGNGGTSYTLSHAVANENEVEIFVNNVRQEGGSGKAYTVNGTALSMTGNVANTDSFYVIFLGKALQTTVPPDGSVSTAKIADDAVTNVKVADNAGIAGSKLGTGAVLQVKYDQTVALDTTATQLPRDDTIPQNDEGKEFMSLAITPISSSSDLIIETELNLDTTVTNYMTVALFQDSTANAISAVYIHMSGAQHTKRIHLKFKMTAGTTSSTTFKVRAGLNASGTVTLNGTNSSRLLGGVCTSYMQITEIGA